MNSENGKPRRHRAHLVLELVYHEVARRLLLGQKPDEISQATRINPLTLASMLRRPEFDAILTELRDKAYIGVDKTIEQKARNISQEIKEAAPKCFDKLMLLMDHAVAEGLQTEIAQDMLDRAGHGVKQPLMPVQININPVEADIITKALELEAEGRKRLEASGAVAQLAKPVEKFEHPGNINRDPSSTSS